MSKSLAQQINEENGNPEQSAGDFSQIFGNLFGDLFDKMNEEDLSASAAPIIGPLGSGAAVPNPMVGQIAGNFRKKYPGKSQEECEKLVREYLISKGYFA